MKINLNRDWLFSKENGAKRIITLPHDAMLEEKRDPDCCNGANSGYFPGGKYTYEKNLTLKEEELHKDLRLFFEGVYQNCTVSVNGKKAGGHKYGYTEFTISLNKYVHAGDNEIIVNVNNSLEPNCRWYSGSGIYRSVWLLEDELNDPVITTVSTSPAVIHVDAKNPVEIYEDEACIYQGNPGDITIDNAKLWDTEHPYLYRCVQRRGNETKETLFGIRTLGWSAAKGLLINGNRTLLRGGCIHHDNGILGACDFAEASERRVRILKEAGYNAIRSAHNPISRSMLDACDRLGMLIMDECFDGWYIPKTYHDYSRYFSSEWKDDLRTMIEKDINHPCVIMYSIGNEVSETASEKGVKVCRKLADHVRSLDHTRPVTCGINVLLNVYTNMGLGVYKDEGEYKPEPLPRKDGKYKEKKTGSAFFNAAAQKLGAMMFFMSKGSKGDKASRGAAEGLDILGLNYAASRYDEDVVKYPQRVMVGSETMITDQPYNWARVKKYPAVVGDFVWAAWDYLGEACVGDWTYHSSKGLPLLAGSGTIDITGKPGPEVFYQQIIWGMRKEPYIAVQPMNHLHETPSKSAWRMTNAIDSWTWSGYEGQTATVEVYADCAKVRLELNGRLIATEPVKDYKCRFRCPYEPGTLTAQALDENGREVSRSSLTSGNDDEALNLNPEKTVIHCDELVYIPIEFTDSKGILKPYIEIPVYMQVDGAGKLQGLGSALAKTDGSYLSASFTSCRGRLLAAVRAGHHPGIITVSASNGLTAPVTVEIKVEE